MRLPSFLKSAGKFTAAAGGPTRQDTYAITVSIAHPVNGTMLNYGIWDKMTGGGVSSSAASYRPGAMAPPVSLGGQRVTANIVVSRLYRLGRDHDVVGQMLDSVGRSKMTVSKQPLDIEGNVYGDPIVYNGKLDRCTPPEIDSEGNAAGIIELEMVVEGYPSA
jgi:hypothetical protein